MTGRDSISSNDLLGFSLHHCFGMAMVDFLDCLIWAKSWELYRFVIVTLSLFLVATIGQRRKFHVLESKVARDQFKPGPSRVYFLSDLETRKSGEWRMRAGEWSRVTLVWSQPYHGLLVSNRKRGCFFRAYISQKRVKANQTVFRFNKSQHSTPQFLAVGQ